MNSVDTSMAAAPATPFDELGKTDANFVALSPTSFVRRTAAVYPDKDAWRHGARSVTWAACFERCRRLGSWLERQGVARGTTVSAILPNIPAMFELHFAAPATGAVLNTLNIRLDAGALAFQLDHGQAQILFVDSEFLALAEAAVEASSVSSLTIIEVPDEDYPASGRYETYEDVLTKGDPNWGWRGPVDEWDAIGLNYTSGTTGNPKGVVVHHRGAYLNAVSNIISCNLGPHEVYLWTLPMFHCNGWCFPWTLALLGGTAICLRKVDPDVIFDLIARHDVTLMCGAPIVYSTMLGSDARLKNREKRKVKALFGGAAPPGAVIEACAGVGIEMVHAYGLTEVYGPASICAPQTDWQYKSNEERARLFSRQGVTDCLQEHMDVVDPETGESVPHDGETMGEIVFRGNIVMKGYLKNPDATRDAFRNGVFNTGDLAVMDPDGYVRILDRSKDIIISGGENISSIEVEDVLYRHPAVLFAAVVAKPDEKWGEVPCACVELAPGKSATEDEIIEFCRDHMARFKAPKAVVFGELPKTSTGKIQKFALRKVVSN